MTHKNQSKLLDTSAAKEEWPRVWSHHLFCGVLLLPAQRAWRQYVSPLSNNMILSQAAGPHTALSFLLCGFSNSDANSLPNILPPWRVGFFLIFLFNLLPRGVLQRQAGSSQLPLFTLLFPCQGRERNIFFCQNSNLSPRPWKYTCHLQENSY